ELFINQNETTTQNKILDIQQKVEDSIITFNKTINDVTNEIKGLSNWFDSSALNQEIIANKNQYTTLVANLQASGVNNPSEYESLIGTRKALSERLSKIAADEKTIEQKKEEIVQSYKKLVELRKELTARRRQFLVDINDNNTNFKVNVDFCGDKQFLESSFRNAINKN
ncbi:TPA: hypothetical protein K8C08_004356, partial [Salmonella enterica subsp. enterica serovar Welikade]|nr:hypothetical protein [Salmonella enterica subsp. enterica serovar Welikade]